MRNRVHFLRLPCHTSEPPYYPRPCHKRSDSLRCPTAKAGSVVGRSCFYLGAKKGRRTFFVRCPLFSWQGLDFVSPCFVCFAFHVCTLVIEGAALKLLQAFRERLDLKLASSPFCFSRSVSLRFWVASLSVFFLPIIMNYAL